MIVYIMIDERGRNYVGKTTLSIPECWNEHLIAADSGSMLHLHRAMREHGSGSFSIAVLKTCSSLEELDAVELSYLNGCTPV